MSRAPWLARSADRDQLPTSGATYSKVTGDILTGAGATYAAPPRSRAVYAALVALTVLLGLASRQFRATLPTVVGDYAGDTLWAAMVFFLAAALWPSTSIGRLAAGALAFAVAIEMSQLYHAPWIDAIRATRAGALVLGFGFLWSDLLCYAVGVALAALSDAAARPRREPARA